MSAGPLLPEHVLLIPSNKLPPGQSTEMHHLLRALSVMQYGALSAALPFGTQQNRHGMRWISSAVAPLEKRAAGLKSSAAPAAGRI